MQLENKCARGGIGRRASLRGWYSQECAGSTPVARTIHLKTQGEFKDPSYRSVSADQAVA